MHQGKSDPSPANKKTLRLTVWHCVKNLMASTIMQIKKRILSSGLSHRKQSPITPRNPEAGIQLKWAQSFIF